MSSKDPRCSGYSRGVAVEVEGADSCLHLCSFKCKAAAACLTLASGACPRHLRTLDAAAALAENQNLRSTIAKLELQLKEQTHACVDVCWTAGRQLLL